MRSRRQGVGILTLLGLLMMAVTQHGESDSMAAEYGSALRDRVTLPPQRSEFTSSSGQFCFVLTGSERWQPPRSDGELWKIEDGIRHRLWKRSLPHRFRPRYVVVADNGNVLLFDEWLNMESPYAITLLNSRNDVVATYSFNHIQQILNIPAQQIIRMAKHGWWITEPPVVDQQTHHVRVKSAGLQLAIDPETGSISVLQEP
jgi:hypothetical protein